MVNIGNSWDEILKDEFKKDYYLKLREFLKEEYSTRIIYPDMYNIFNALKYTAYEDVKVVLLGQDPYHEPGQAQGLCFSVPSDFKKPPSLVNMYKELKDELGIDRTSGSLEDWARQGVLLRCPYREKRRSRFPRGQGLGSFHGQGHRDLKRQRRPLHIPPLGRLCEKEKSPHHKLPALRAGVGASVSIVCPQRLLRKRTFQKSKRNTGVFRKGPHRLVEVNQI